MADLAKYLKNNLNAEIECFVFDSIPSTSDYLLSLEFAKNPQVCIASAQTAGKGQYHRQWLSRQNGSILFSIRRVFRVNRSLSGLSLAMGIAVIDTLKQHNIGGLKLKWPNDVYFENKKLAGILLENLVKGEWQSVVVGLGLNVDLAEDFSCPTPWIDLQRISTTPIGQLALTADLIKRMQKYLSIFATQGFAAFYSKWAALDYLLGKAVKYTDKTQSFNGVCAGVSSQGFLLLETKAGIKQIYSSKFLRFG